MNWRCMSVQNNLDKTSNEIFLAIFKHCVEWLFLDLEPKPKQNWIFSQFWQNSNEIFWIFSNTVTFCPLPDLNFKREKIQIIVSNPINPRMIWILVIQDWELFKVQFQQDFRTLEDEMDSWPTSTWTFWPYFKKFLRISNDHFFFLYFFLSPKY